jgi:diguanylate cyclase (GGDEF)-like protein
MFVTGPANLSENTSREDSLRVGVVDSSPSFRRLLRSELEGLSGIRIREFENLQQLLSSDDFDAANYLCCLIDDMFLAEATDEQRKQLVGSRIPLVGLGDGVWMDAMGGCRTWMELPNRIESIERESPTSLFRIARFVERIRDNSKYSVLLLSPDTVSRANIAALLSCYRLNVLSASNLGESLRLLDEQRDIRLVVVGSHLAGISGEEMIRCLRSTHDFQSLAIMGLAENGDRASSLGLLRSGANDCMTAPFSSDEFFYRMMNLVGSIETIDKLISAATRDHLTDLYNRRYLFDMGGKYFASSQRGQIELSAAMIDIDHFKSINDTYGHEAGNAVLTKVAEILTQRFRKTDIVARVGGEEFAVLMVNMSTEGMVECFEGLRAKIAATEFVFDNKSVNVTASFGLVMQSAESLGELLNEADKMLYVAKSRGRNRVEMEQAIVDPHLPTQKRRL